MQWRFLQEKVPHSLEDVESILLSNRHILDKKVFFDPPNPLHFSVEELGIDLTQLRKAKKRILEAIKKKEKILVFGDYDADGMCATAVLWSTLHTLGADALPFIPHREKHGYGLTWAALEEISKNPLPSLLITVDTGIVAHQAVKELTEKRVDVIITDHHQPEETFPEALAVVHSTQICGSAVAWVLARELQESTAEAQLDLVGLATVTDLMPLQGINRSFVAHGLRVMNQRQRPGLVALRTVAGLAEKPLEASHLGFALGPRLNAMGRLSHALDGLRLLCTANPKRALQLAGMVDSTNGERQQLTEDLFQLAHQQVQQQKGEHILVVYAPEFHEGVIGLIAGRLTERYAKPSIVISTRGDTAKASARSLPGINITEIIRTARDLLLEFGGHPMAAGFGFEHTNLNAVIEHLWEYGRTHINPELLHKTLDLECLLPLDLVSIELVESLKRFAPFGQGNPEPIFAFQDIRIAEIQTIGNQHQHLKLLLKDAGSNAQIPVLAWGKGQLVDSLSIGSLVNVACVLQVNEWKDRKSVQAVLKDLQLAEAV